MDEDEQHAAHHGQPLWERILGTAADGVEIAATAGSHLAEEVPLLASVVHGGLGAYHAGKGTRQARDGTATRRSR